MKNGRSNRRTGSPLNKFIRCSIKWSQNATQTTTVSTNISVPSQQVSANKNVQAPISDIEKEMEDPDWWQGKIDKIGIFQDSAPIIAFFEEKAIPNISTADSKLQRWKFAFHCTHYRKRVEFLHSLCKRGVTYSVINTARSSLSSFIMTESCPLSKH